MNLRHSKAYEELALHAGREAGQDNPTPESVAEDAAARAMRDSLWAEYEQVLRDHQTYNLDDIHAWLAARGVDLSVSSCNRDRKALESKERSFALAAVRARELVAAAKGAGNDLLAAALAKGEQAAFEFLTNFDAAALDGLKPGQVVGLLDVLNRMNVGREQAGILKTRLADLQRKIDEAKAAADKQAKAALESKGVDAKTIDQIRQIYGLPPLAEVAGAA